MPGAIASASCSVFVQTPRPSPSSPFRCMKFGAAWQLMGTQHIRQNSAFANPTHLLEEILHPSFQADCASYAPLLRACTCAKALPHGQLIHDHIIKTGLEHNVYLHNLIIDMYGHCDGALPMAYFLFAKMAYPDLFSWNFIIRAYTHAGLYVEALGLFQRMQGQGTMPPDQYIYVSVLSVCTSINLLERGKQLHVHIAWNGFELEMVIATALINMYGKCGSIIDAWVMFDRMPLRDMMSWNTIIAACVRHDHGKFAFQLAKQLQEEGELPNKNLILTLLDACGNQGALLEGKRIHVCVAGKDLDVDLMMQTALSNMYAKCVSVKNVQSTPDTTSLNGPLLHIPSIYARRGLIDEAFQTFEQLKHKGVLPDRYSLASIISACASQSAFLEGEQVHAYIAGTRMELDVVVGAALINMYGKSRKPEVARALFDRMPIHDVVSWTAMIATYTQNGETKNAIALYKQMKLKGVQPNKMTFATVFDACTFEDSLTEGRRVHEEILGSKLESDIFVGTSLVNMYGRFGCLENASRIFNRMLAPDVIAWNALIAASSRNGEGVRALQHFRQMQEEGTLPNKVTTVSIFNACAIHLALLEGKRIHAQVVALNLESDIVVGTALIHVYGRCGCVMKARTVFDAILFRDTILWTAMMAAYAHQGQISEAFKLFDEMQSKGVIPDKISCISILSACVSKTGIDDGRKMHTRAVFCGLDLDVSIVSGLITMYGKCGSIYDAIRTLEITLRRDRDMYISILSACANQPDIVEGRRTHGRVVETGLELEVPVGNAIINMYSKCGILEEARIVFENMPERDIVSWTVMITSLAQHGRGDDALHLFDQMQSKGLFPNKVTFVNILNAFTHSGMVDEGFQYFGYICQTHSTTFPIVDHYNIIVDLLGKAGRLSEAEDLIKKMPFPATACTWTSLLDACRHHRDVERGERAAELVFRMKPRDPAPYITMYNLYTSVGRSNDAATVIYRLKEKGLLNTETAACVRTG